MAVCGATRDNGALDRDLCPLADGCTRARTPSALAVPLHRATFLIRLQGAMAAMRYDTCTRQLDGVPHVATAFAHLQARWHAALCGRR